MAALVYVQTSFFLAVFQPLELSNLCGLVPVAAPCHDGPRLDKTPSRGRRVWIVESCKLATDSPNQNAHSTHIRVLEVD